MYRIHPNRLILSAKTIEKLIKKHHIRPEEVREVVRGAPLIRSGRSRGIYNVYGRTEAGRYLTLIVRDLGKGWARMLTARPMSEAERRRYQKQRHRS